MTASVFDDVVVACVVAVALVGAAAAITGVPVRGITKVSIKINVIEIAMMIENTAVHRYGFRKNFFMLEIRLSVCPLCAGCN